MSKEVLNPIQEKESPDFGQVVENLLNFYQNICRLEEEGKNVGALREEVEKRLFEAVEARVDSQIKKNGKR